MDDYGLLLENPRRRRRRRRTTRRRTTRRRRRRNPVRARRRRRNPGAVATNPRRRRRRTRRRRTYRRRRRNQALFPRMGDMQRTFRRATQILVGEFVGDVGTRMATKFGVGRLLTQMRVPAPAVLPVTRIVVGLFAPALLRMLPGRLFNADFRATFGAVNVASGLIGLTQNMRAQLLQTMGLAGYELADYGEMDDYEFADNGISDWETADDGVGLGHAPPAGVLGDTPAGVLDYDSGVMEYASW